jgi:cytochrome P450
MDRRWGHNVQLLSVTRRATVSFMTDLFTNPDRYADLDAWHREADALRAAGPVQRVDQSAAGFAPFWAVLGHDQVMTIERQAANFTNAPQPVLGRTEDMEKQAAMGAGLRTLIHMDAPDHLKYRMLTADWFKPSSLARLQARLDELSAQVVSRMEAHNGACDFSRDIAVWYPLQVILAILGLPESDYPRMLKLTQELFGATDDELGRGALGIDDMIAVILDFYGYFMGVTAERRAKPGDDLASMIANGAVDGAPMPDMETVSYYTIVATAGHDTTSSALTGGMQALIENPSVLAQLQDDPSLIPNAVDEMIRYSSPVRHFMRTAHVDIEIGGQQIKKGDWLYLSYLAANRDPKVFPDPHRFDPARANADKHIAFGFGAHFCLGAQLARMELRTVFRDLLPRIKSIELAGTPTSMKTTFVGGPKSLPIRYELT